MEQTPADVTAGAVRAEMARHRVTVRELADDTGIKKSTLARRLTGEHAFTITQLVAIADRLEVPLTTLLPPGTVRAA